MRFGLQVSQHLLQSWPVGGLRTLSGVDVLLDKDAAELAHLSEARTRWYGIE
jgi:hypothetical protein